MKTKPIFIVVLTLVIGFILGMLTSAQLRIHKLKPMRVYFSEERFMEGFYKIIVPDEKQKAEIDKIVQKYAKINSDLQGNFRKELESNMKGFRKEIDSELTKEQLARLKEMDERLQEMFRQGRRDWRDSSNNRDFRRFDRNGGDGRQFHNNRPMPPPAGPRPQQDSIVSPDVE